MRFEMTQWVQVHVAKPDDLNLILRILIVEGEN